jgi:short-subunit dehydrogenase
MVTGASSGIGESITRRLAAAGTDLVLVARNKARLDELAGELHDRHRVDVEVLVADLNDPDQLAAVERRVAAEGEPVDLLVNNAGFGFTGRFGDIPVEDEAAAIQVMVTAVVRLTHAAVTRMRATAPPLDRRQPVGGVLLVSSLASFEPNPLGAIYAATKAFVTSFGQAVHEEARRDGIVVTTVCPGYTHTDFHARADMDMSHLAAWMWQSADQVAAASLAALDRRRALVVPGIGNKTTQVALRILPTSVARRTTAAVLLRRDD